MKNCIRVRDYVIKELNNQYDKAFAYDGLEHLLGVAQYAGTLAKQRNEDPYIAMTCGYLHDLATFKTHYSSDHANRSAKMASEILSDITTYDTITIKRIVQAIANHSSKERIDDSLDEILKDADVLSHYALNSTSPKEESRLKQLLQK